MTSDRTQEGDSSRHLLDWILTGGAAFALLLGVAIPPDRLAGLPPFCPFFRFTGLPCPGCGLTRAFCYLGHGDMLHAWRMNPFVFVFAVAALALLLRPWWRRRWPHLESRLLAASWVLCSAILLLAAMLAYDAWRIVRLLRP